MFKKKREFIRNNLSSHTKSLLNTKKYKKTQATDYISLKNFIFIVNAFFEIGQFGN